MTVLVAKLAKFGLKKHDGGAAGTLHQQCLSADLSSIQREVQGAEVPLPIACWPQLLL